jgi:hypothetical protein
MIHGNCNYIGYFIRQVEWKREFNLNGATGCLRPIAELIVWRFSGLSMHDVARYFNLKTHSLKLDIERYSGYEQVGDPRFIKYYNELLTLYIESSKHFIKRTVGIRLS